MTGSTERDGLLWHLANANSFVWFSVVNRRKRSLSRRSTWKPHVCIGLERSQFSARCPPLVASGGTLYTKHSSTFINVWRSKEPLCSLISDYDVYRYSISVSSERSPVSKRRLHRTFIGGTVGGTRSHPDWTNEKEFLTTTVDLAFNFLRYSMMMSHRNARYVCSMCWMDMYVF